eukprot:PhF_6_TR39890/c0_g1_i1/m.59301
MDIRRRVLREQQHRLNNGDSKFWRFFEKSIAFSRVIMGTAVVFVAGSVYYTLSVTQVRGGGNEKPCLHCYPSPPPPTPSAPAAVGWANRVPKQKQHEQDE